MILLTGASGFLGKAIANSVEKKKLITLGRSKCKINCDLSTDVPIICKHELVIHAAGKAHAVPSTKIEKEAFFNINVEGTKNLLRGIEQAPALPRAFIFISSVAVYGCDSGVGITESNSLNAKDPYGLSKIQAENIIQEWCLQHGVLCTILRLPLLVGRKPPGNLGAMIRGIKRRFYVNIAGGNARKSMVLVDDVVKILSVVGYIGGIYNLTDGYHPSFKELSSKLAINMGIRQPKNLPIWVVKIMAKIGDLIGSKSPINTKKLEKITSDLTFDDTKARLILGWNPKSVLNNLIVE